MRWVVDVMLRASKFVTSQSCCCKIQKNRCRKGPKSRDLTSIMSGTKMPFPGHSTRRKIMHKQKEMHSRQYGRRYAEQ
jgi:hypothetical protein